MSVARCMQEVSHREYLSWRHYLSQQIRDSYNQPSPTDYYLMQVAFWIFRTANPKRRARVIDFILKFVDKEDMPKPTPEQKAQMLEMSKQAWRARLGTAGTWTDGDTSN